MLRRLLLLAVLPLTACQTAGSDPDLAVRVFDQLAYRGTAGAHPNSFQLMLETDYEKGRLSRWEEPVWVTVEGVSSTGKAYAQIQRIMGELGAVAGTEINYVEPDGSRRKGNFRFSFLDQENLIINKSEFASCAAWVNRYGDGRIKSVHVRIAMKNAKRLQRCIYHEVLHGFGLAHTTLVPSVMNYGSDADSPTAWDLMVLRTMYSKTFESGMTRQDSLHLARRAVQTSQQ